MSLEIEDIEGMQSKPDFRRANGAPMVTDKDGKNQRLSRPSGWGKMLDDENALVNWKLNTAAKGVAGDSSLQAEWVAVKDDDRQGMAGLREKSIQAGRGNQAADTGTALHAMSERWEDPDDDFKPTGKYKKSLAAMSYEMERIGIKSERMEYTVVNMEYRAAGTCDRLYRLTKDLVTPKGTTLPAGTLVIGDLKTGKTLDFSLPGYHVQMALYALGEFYDVENDLFLPTPEVDTDWGLLVHMPASGEGEGTCQILWCDLDVGNYGAYLVNEIKDWRRKWKNGTYASPVVNTPGTIEATAIHVADPVERIAVQDMVPFIKARIAAIRGHEKAANELQLTWPDGVPGPGRLDSADHIRQVLYLLDKIEATYGLPFPEGDPRVQEPGIHLAKSQNALGAVQEEVTS